MMVTWAVLLVIMVYLGIPAWLFLRHNRRTPIRQIFLFHPVADAGGGGEACLWLLLREAIERASLLTAKPLRFTLFVHKNTPHIRTLLSNVDRDFGIKFPSYSDAFVGPVVESGDATRLTKTVTLKLVRLYSSQLLFEKYSFATQMLQFFAGGLVGLEAAIKTKGNYRDIIWDTMGITSAVATFSWLTCQFRRRCFCYIHYPFISPALRLNKNLPLYRKLYLSTLKMMYRTSGNCYSRPVTVNSTFTKTGIESLWNLNEKDVSMCFPPVTCPSTGFSLTNRRPNTILSLAQFRPEKNHTAQIEAVAKLAAARKLPNDFQLIMCGSVRPGLESDVQYVTSLLERAEKVLPPSRVAIACRDHSSPDPVQGLEWEKSPDRISEDKDVPCVRLLLNSPRTVIEKHLSTARVSPYLQLISSAPQYGLHTMEQEHFGIAVAEMAVFGCEVIAHSSGGPRDDILRGATDLELKEAGVSRAIVGDGPLGHFFEGGVDALSEVIDTVLSTAVDEELLSARVAVLKNRFKTGDFGGELLNTWGCFNKKTI